MIIAGITMSVDGFVTGPDAGPQHPLGVGGDALHDWVFRGSPEDRKVLDDATEATGAIIMGRHTFDVVDSEDGWNDELGYGADRDQSAAPPAIVVTSDPPQHVRLAERFEFADDLSSALARATELAGDKHVVIMGGGALIASALRLGIVERLTLHVAPLLLGDGSPLFDDVHRVLELESTVLTSSAVHLTYRVR